MCLQDIQVSRHLTFKQVTVTVAVSSPAQLPDVSRAMVIWAFNEGSPADIRFGAAAVTETLVPVDLEISQGGANKVVTRETAGPLLLKPLYVITGLVSGVVNIYWYEYDSDIDLISNLPLVE